MQIFLHFFAKKVIFSCIYQNKFVNLCDFLLRIAPNCPKTLGKNGVIVLIMVRAVCRQTSVKRRKQKTKL